MSGQSPSVYSREGLNSKDTALSEAVKAKEMQGRQERTIMANIQICENRAYTLAPDSVERIFPRNSPEVKTLRSQNLLNFSDIVGVDGKIHQALRCKPDLVPIWNQICIPDTHRVITTILYRFNHPALQTGFQATDNEKAIIMYTDASRAEVNGTTRAGLGVQFQNSSRGAYSIALPASTPIAAAEAHALAYGVGLHDQSKPIECYTDSETTIKWTERLVKKKPLSKHTPLQAIEPLHAFVEVKRLRQASTTIHHVLAHTTDDTHNATEKKRRKEEMQRRYGNRADMIAKGNARADKRAKSALANKPPNITIESRVLPRFLPYDTQTKAILNDINAHLKKDALASLLKQLRHDVHYKWLDRKDIAWKASALLGKRTDPALNKLQNFAIKARRALLLDKQTIHLRQTGPKPAHWLKRYKIKVNNDKCDMCGEVENRFHFVRCKALAQHRKDITSQVLNLINKELEENIEHVPVFWDDEQKGGKPNDDTWREVEKHTAEFSAMGLIPNSFINFLQGLRWRSTSSFPNTVSEIQITVVQGHYNSWLQRCKIFYETNRPDQQPRADRERAKLELRAKRREEKIKARIEGAPRRAHRENSDEKRNKKRRPNQDEEPPPPK